MCELSLHAFIQTKRFFFGCGPFYRFKITLIGWDLVTVISDRLSFEACCIVLCIHQNSFEERPSVRRLWRILRLNVVRLRDLWPPGDLHSLHQIWTFCDLPRCDVRTTSNAWCSLLVGGSHNNHSGAVTQNGTCSFAQRLKKYFMSGCSSTKENYFILRCINGRFITAGPR